MYKNKDILPSLTVGAIPIDSKDATLNILQPLLTTPVFILSAEYNKLTLKGNPTGILVRAAKSGETYIGSDHHDCIMEDSPHGLMFTDIPRIDVDAMGECPANAHASVE